MTGLNLFIVGAIVIAIFIFGIWLTVSDFKNIEEGKTGRRKHIEEDMRIDDKK